MSFVLCRVTGVTQEKNKHRIGAVVRRLDFYRDGETTPDGATKKGDGYECICEREIVFFAPEHLEVL